MNNLIRVLEKNEASFRKFMENMGHYADVGKKNRHSTIFLIQSEDVLILNNGDVRLDLFKENQKFICERGRVAVKFHALNNTNKVLYSLQSD
jgi:hypothetical protein